MNGLTRATHPWWRPSSAQSRFLNDDGMRVLFLGVSVYTPRRLGVISWTPIVTEPTQLQLPLE